ncbi:rRNA methyltransferase [Flavobacterium akiainvivens]|uniref:tRNA (guanosine(18)-2'-O)-methyltransferase n=1 Tax=Flavobacterium akiainvivens TaxID=1202724 RepID=A0A0M9VGU9_9FLAO|nr:RNA methyltransferase [Flavobacterium akiainvivens]KOS04869.1 rRNA methyltransferase [Flavobacterium akiainvivens]SFQ42949.1 tRNA (guanosine-2'-O-)-methyltransferase [Flavobacterium akiainvivens]
MKDIQLTRYLNYLENFITENRRDTFLRILAQRSRHFTVAIQDIFQLHNTSAVLRTCEVFGVQELNVIEEKMGKTIDKEIALGAQKWVDVNRFASTARCISDLKQQGYRIIATTPHEDSCYLDDFDVTTPFALFFGTEIDGLTDEVLKNADGFLKIPMLGFTESLNISSSAAIIIQHLSGKIRKAEDINWQLTEQQVLEKRIDWAEKSIKDIDFVKSRYIPEEA